ncbi:hypothetical protein C0033_02950 [Clostridium sp. chh4-2]|uniref:PTS sugar transporter subunit IIA n=1 Tax=Clostridium sp. chh4-2 TaxID=2067550 RepID=UPI000CCF42E8|nr:PTS sugar transporter subunit IIA [Clostridium sp. chh4-2]PNV63630.1 hypothetical protein C0033_02950 [Clostridium sp. chh4-2]
MEILIVSHRGIASGIKSTVDMVLGDSSHIKTIELTEEGVDSYVRELESYLTGWLTEGRQGIIFADIKGGTPFNQAELLLNKHQLKDRAKVISGVNLPMIVDACFRELDVNRLEELEGLMSNGREGISCSELCVQTDSSDDE